MSDLYTQLRRYFVRILRDKDLDDQAQVPAEATVDFYRQGATVKGPQLLPPEGNVQIPVYDVGAIKTGDTIQIGESSTPSETVLDVPDRQTIEIQRNHSFPIFEGGERLVPITDRPAVFREGTGTEQYSGNSLMTDAVTGNLPPAFLRERFFDAIVWGDELATQVFLDQYSGHTQHPIDAREFDSIEAAMEAAPEGGAVHLPAGEWLLAQEPHQRIIIIKSLTLFGDGKATVLRTGSPVLPAIDVIGDMSNVIIRDLSIDGGATEAAESDGIRFQQQPQRISIIRLENLNISNCGANGISMKNHNWPLILNCNLTNNFGNGILLEGCIQANIMQCHAAANHEHGIFADASVGTYLYGCGVEGNQKTPGLLHYSGQVRLKVAHFSAVRNCDIEEMRQADGEGNTIAEVGLVLENANAVVIEANNFENSLAEEDTVGIRVIGPSEGVHIGPNAFALVNTAIELNPTSNFDNRGVVLFPQWIKSGTGSVKYPDGIEADGLRQFIFQNGLKVPQWGDVVPSASPENEGMIIYVRDGQPGEKFQGSDGTQWVPLG